ncbi:helix-turn-helix transcriptional regulator [Gandjariella thermophila]|uniref:LuxR family transcriptional regulator n=1 Tax=Gandjariella thermophila TaxID=1931992 RepID=A0A4D4JBZ6_9PSEU|nr:LuxR family transcriptional regulator [Gandjariella thermophila]GDY31966.1 LuxR family transcriptional regulator [Gandjariella thermophila]
MPTVARLGSGIPLVARGREMRGLRAALDRAAAGSAGAVLLSGDAGVGKSRLVSELTRVAEEQGALVLTGRCVDVGETGLPYLPFAEAFGQVPPEALGAVRARPALGRLLPGLATPAASERNHDSGAGMVAPEVGVRTAQDMGQLQLFDAAHGLLGELAEQRCVLLVVEDVHWAEASTRNLLSFLLARLRAQRLLVLVSYRADDLHRTHPLRLLLAELVRLPAVERLELAPFGPEDARAFVSALADGTLPESAVAQIAERSEGNAFFAEELVAAYADCADGLPWVLVDVLLARVERLSPAAQRVVRMASVSGRWVRHARLRAVAALDADDTGREPMTDAELHDALREAVAHHVLVVDGDEDLLAFRHALLHEAVYGDLLPGERVRLHAAYARQLATEQGVRGAAAALAHHSMESHALPQALAASVAAAQEARDLGAPAAALRHFEQALKLWCAVPEAARPPGVDEASLYGRSSYVAGTAGEPERAVAYARSAVELADRTGVPERAAEARRRLAQALFALDGKEAEAAECVERAWELVRDRPPSHTSAWVLAVRARVLRASAGMAEARVCAEQAVRHARESGTVSAEADALITMAVLDDMAASPDTSAKRLTEAVELARGVDALNVELRARYNLAVNRYEQGLLDAAALVVDEAVARARDAGLTWSAYGLELRILQIVVREARGDWDGAAAAAEPPGRRVSSTVSARLAAAGASLLVNRGRFGEAERLLAQLTAEWHLDMQIVRLSAAAGAELACWQGRPREAAELLDRALRRMREIDPDWPIPAIRLAALGVAAHADLADQARRNRDAEAERAAVAAAATLVDRLGDPSGSRPRSGELGPEGRAWLARLAAERGRLGGAGDPAAWRAAAEAFAGYGEVYRAAVCRWRLGAALIAAQRRDEAAEELSAAHEAAESLGALPLRDAVTQLARRARIAVAPAAAPPAAGPDPLTPRERAVLDLVALGRTNRQVGEELFISEKTVSVHLSRVMAKLGASRRAEAVAIAYDRGLIARVPDG